MIRGVQAQVITMNQVSILQQENVVTVVTTTAMDKLTFLKKVLIREGKLQ